MDIANEVRELILEATDWTYQDFKDATTILANRLNQLAVFCDVDTPGPEQAQAMDKVANMCRIYYDKCMKAFRDNEPTSTIQSVDTNTEPVFTREELQQFMAKLQELDFDCKYFNVTGSYAICEFKAITKIEKYKVWVMCHINKMLTHRNIEITITQLDDKDNKKTETSQKYTYRDLNSLDDVFKAFVNGLESYDKEHPQEQGAYASV